MVLYGGLIVPAKFLYLCQATLALHPLGDQQAEGMAAASTNHLVDRIEPVDPFTHNLIPTSLKNWTRI
jgi:hypothetical protein